MKKVIAALAFAAAATTAWAACTTHTTTYSDGRRVTCMTCCYAGNCNTNCF